MEALKIIKGLVLLFLLIGLSISSLIEIKKFFGKKTMVTIYNEPQDKLSLPLITICGNPPLKDEFFTPGLAFSYLNFTPIVGNKNLTYLWNEKVSMTNVSLATVKNQTLNVEVVETIQLGRCLIIEESKEFTSSSALSSWSITVQYGNKEDIPSELSVYVHPKSERYGAVTAFVGGYPSTTVIPTNSYTIFTMRKIAKEKVKNCAQNSQGSLLTCGVSQIAEEFMVGNGSKWCSQFDLCKIPQVETLLEKTGYDLDLCNLTSLAQYQCMYNKAVTSRLTERVQRCQNPCSTTSYEVSAASVKQSQRMSFLTFQFASTEVEIHEELLIYDFSSIIASVGGLLGLFVGISFLDITLGIIEYIYNRASNLYLKNKM